MLINTGIYRGRNRSQMDGWKILCEQEKTPHTYKNLRKCSVIVCEEETPSWLEEYMAQGGTAIVTGVKAGSLYFKTDYVGQATIEYVDLTELDSFNTRVQTTVGVFNGKGIGKITLHENRITKLGIKPDEYPAVLFQPVGKGGCWYSGIPFSELINALGDTLRKTDSFSDFEERITSVDKNFLLRAMRNVLIRAFEKCGVPYVHLSYYPDNYHSVFAFRVDIDGIYGDNLERISRSGVENEIPISFFINKDMCMPEKSKLFMIDSYHDIGNHAVVHNLYTSFEDNLLNITDCKKWLDGLKIKNGPWFVAPRGMWNYNLGRALEKCGIEYTSDFGYCINGLPFYPYWNGSRMKVMQIPTNPFSSERAFAQSGELGNLPPTDEWIAKHFEGLIEEQYTLGMPIILYSHPQYFGTMSQKVLQRIKAAVDKLNVWQTTLSELAKWWSKRDKINYSVDYCVETKELKIIGSISADIIVKVIKLEI